MNVEDFEFLVKEGDYKKDEGPEVEGDYFVFPKKKKRVLKKRKFTLKLSEGNQASFTAEQIEHCYRTRDLALGDYLRQFHGHELYVKSSQRGQVIDYVKQVKDSVRESKVLKVTSLTEALKRERKLFDRNQALTGPRSFQEVIDLDSRSKSADEERAKKVGLGRHKRNRPMGRPIIVVPPTATAVLNLYNIKQFLEDRIYIPPEVVKKERPTESKPQNTYVTMKKHAKAGDVSFKVVDSVTGFDQETWDRVVAVVVSGQAWQLKGWKWETPADIFTHVKGFYVYFDDAKLPDIIKGWNVSKLPIKHESRNMDIMQAHEMWTQINSHMARTHPVLLEGLISEAEARERAEREARQQGIQAEIEDEEDDEHILNV